MNFCNVRFVGHVARKGKLWHGVTEFLAANMEESLVDPLRLADKFDVHVSVLRGKFLIIKPTRWARFLKFILEMKFYIFRTVPLSIIRSFSLYTAMVYVIQVCWHIQLPCVQWKTPDDGQRNCPKHVEFRFKNKFEKLVHPAGFIIRN